MFYVSLFQVIIIFGMARDSILSLALNECHEIGCFSFKFKHPAKHAPSQGEINY